MHSHELTTGRTFGLRFDPGESFYPTLSRFCRDHKIRSGYVPMFLAAFAEADIVGTCDKLDNPQAPVWSKVHVTNAEALGCGTIAYDDTAGEIHPHVHISLGLKEQSANGYTSHLLTAEVQFLVEMILVEVTTPAMSRPPDPSLYDVPRLTFTNAQGRHGARMSAEKPWSGAPGVD